MNAIPNNVGLKPHNAEPSRGASQYATVEQIEQVMGLAAGTISPVAWLVLQEEADGVSIEVIAERLRVDISDIETLRDRTTGLEGDDSKALWQTGIIGLRTVAIVNQQNLATGWDAIEAMAVDKAARTLSAMRGPGDLERMMALAAMANKAIRRSKGEGEKKTGSVSIELNSGKLGMIRLNLSPAIQQQLSSPTRVIDAVRGKDYNTQGKQTNLEMLNLRDTRALALQEGEKVVTPVADVGEHGGMTFEWTND
jgi:hypothetical protein